MASSKFSYAALGAVDPIRSAFQALTGARANNAMAKAQGGLVGAQTAEAAEQARALNLTNNSRANPFSLLDDPQVAEYAKNNPSYANALRVGLGLFGATGEGDVAGMLSKIQGSDLTGQGVELGGRGDVAGQNRLVSAAEGKTYEPFKAVGNTGFAIDSGTGAITAGNQGLAGVTMRGLESDIGSAEGAPFEVTRNGVPVLVQRYKDGSIRPVEGYGPKLRNDDFSIQTNPDGTVNVTRGTKMPKLTEQQSKDLVYLERGEVAFRNMENLDKVLADPRQRAGAAVPLAGNALVSDDFQRAQQAGREFLAAILRKDTGAAITEQEMEIYGQTYLPQPFDSPAVLQQKAQARRVALDAIRKGLGPIGESATTQADLSGASGAPADPAPPRRPVSRAVYNGRTIIRYDDGSMEYE